MRQMAEERPSGENRRTDKNLDVKIAVLLPSLQVGGAERLVLHELAYLKHVPQFSFELHLVFEQGPLYPSFEALGVPIYVWRAPHRSLGMLLAYAKIVHHLRQWRCSILHSHLLDGVGPLIGKLSGAKVVSTVHNDKRYGLLDRLVLSTSDMVLGCGAHVLRRVREFVACRKTGLLNNAVAQPTRTTVDRNAVLRQYGMASDRKLVVSLGRLTHQKGFDVLISAFRYVIRNVPDAVLIIGGEGEDRSHLEVLVKSSGLEQQVVLPGLVEDVESLLLACDLYVNSSRWEGLPMTLLEAISHGRPVVATDVGGNSEAILDQVTGYLVPPEDPERLSAAVVAALIDNDFAKRASGAALALFQRAFTIQEHCSVLSAHYREVADRNRVAHGRGLRISRPDHRP